MSIRPAILALGVTLTVGAALAGSPPVLLQGRVFSAGTRLVLQDVEVELVVSELQTTTAPGGSFSFGPVDIRIADTLLVTHPGHHQLRLPLGEPGDGHWDLRIFLTPTSGPRSSAPGLQEETR